MTTTMRSLRWLLLALLVLCAPVYSRAEVQFPKTRSYVDDLANVLSPEDEQRLGDLCRDLDRRTGYQLVVVTVPSLEGEDIDHAGTRYIIEKGAGRKGADTGVAIVRAVEERQTAISTGRGTEAIITDAYAGVILRERVRPLTRAGRLGDALYEGASAIRDRILREAGDTAVPNPIPDRPPANGPWGDPGTGFPSTGTYPSGGGGSPFLLLIIGFIVIAAIARAAGKGSRCPRCRSYLSVTEDVVQRPSIFRNGYGIRHRRCPNCGYADERRFTISRDTGGFYGGPTGGYYGGTRRRRRDDDNFWIGGIGGFGGFGGGGGGFGGGGGGGGWSGGGGGGWSGGDGFSGGGGDAGGGGASVSD